MKMLRAIIREEKAEETLQVLSDNGFPSVTIIDVYGRGKQNGITIGDVYYDELPKKMLLMVVEDEDEGKVSSLIIKTARTGEGNFGDGRIFVTSVLRSFTISSNTEGL